VRYVVERSGGSWRSAWTPERGRHEAKSEGPRSITVWGTGEYASYGFAGGMGSRPLHNVTIPVPR
jgi:hypothetical protein